MIVSIDQNPTALWDVPAKLQSLHNAHLTATHYLEDIDLAFADVGSDIPELHLGLEAYHPTGGLNWGAALFYVDFLGRLPNDPHNWEKYLPQRLASLAKQLGEDHDSLYSRFSFGDNWTLLGPNYVEDGKFQRLIGDLSFAETLAPWLGLIDLAEMQCLRRFPGKESQAVLKKLFKAEKRRMEDLQVNLPAGASFIDANRAYLTPLLPKEIKLGQSSELFAIDSADPDSLMDLFTSRYDQAAALYNQALTETNVGINPLDPKRGELPFFAVFAPKGRFLRTGCRLENGTLLINDQEFPLTPDGAVDRAALRKANIIALTPKALLLVLEVRRKAAIAMPHLGSLYMPACFRLETLLREAGLLNAPMEPILRVHFDLFKHMADLETPIGLPDYFLPAAGRETLSAGELSREFPHWQAAARETLEQFTTADGRDRWLAETFPKETAEIDRMERQKRELAKENPKDPAVRDIWKTIRAIQDKLTEAQLDAVARAAWLTEADYTSARGAIGLWAMALGGEGFYHHIIKHSRITEEHAP